VQLQTDFGNRNSGKKLLPYTNAKENGMFIDWGKEKLIAPQFTGTKTIEKISVETLVPYIDWQPFFITWEMHGKFPAILQDEIVGVEAQKLFTDAKNMLEEIVNEKWLEAKAVFGFWEVNKTDADTLTLQHNKMNLEFLRQQMKKADGQPNLSLSSCSDWRPRLCIH
jgi:5-methyltetrahydrofolate--homocysteine methyltransferase